MKSATQGEKVSAFWADKIAKTYRLLAAEDKKRKEKLSENNERPTLKAGSAETRRHFEPDDNKDAARAEKTKADNDKSLGSEVRNYFTISSRYLAKFVDLPYEKASRNVSFSSLNLTILTL